MGIPESQLAIWSHRGAIGTSIATHESIRLALASHAWPTGVRYEVYLQGSYKNYTNTYRDSDVDVVAQLNSTFSSDVSSLSETERWAQNVSYVTANYRWADFRADALQALRAYFGAASVTEGTKTLKVRGRSGRQNADVVVCAQYRRYERFRIIGDQSYVEGMTFFVPTEGRWVVNYPKLHYLHGNEKQVATSEWYKPTVRIFKNVRSYLIGKGNLDKSIAPSYMVECWLYNASHVAFGKSYVETFLNVLNDLLNRDVDTFVCQNEQLMLFGSRHEQWSPGQAMRFVRELLSLWERW
jgi:hypothetical protein